MLPTYGDRILEGLIRGKKREQEHAAAVRELIPELEASYVQLLREWERTFVQTRELLLRSRRALQSSRDEDAQPEGAQLLLPRLLQDALFQSHAFTQHLKLLQEHSIAIRSLPDRIAPLRLPYSEEPYGDASDYDGGPEPADSPMRPDPPDMMGDMSGIVLPTGTVPIGGHKLPPLPYSYKALEPWIDEKTMRIHHDKHHQSYVDGLNKAETKLAEARKSGDFELVKHWERELAFNGAGHYLHTIFWEAMSPKGGGKPAGVLLQEIERSFGSYDAFKKQFSEAANKVEGGGWAILVWSPRSRRLEVLTAEKHQNLSQWDVVPLLPLDVWEHAYYLKHQNDREAYVKDWWNTVNWPYVAQRYHEASKLQWTPW